MAHTDRRGLLATAGGLLTTVTAGCGGLVSSERGPPGADCTESSRPTPGTPDAADAIEPAPYPDPPSDSADEGDVVSYANEFEWRYRRNELLDRHGSAVVEFGFETFDTWTGDVPEAAPDGAVVAGVEYGFTYSLRDDGIEESRDNVAVYYVDASAAVRAHGKRGTEPDPWESGVTVACFQ